MLKMCIFYMTLSLNLTTDTLTLSRNKNTDKLALSTRGNTDRLQLIQKKNGGGRGRGARVRVLRSSPGERPECAACIGSRGRGARK